MGERKRSHWGWGWEDALPDRESRENLGQMVEAMLGFEPQPIREPVAEDQVVLRAPRVSALPESLASVVDFSTSARLRHTYGSAYPDYINAFYGDFEGPPDAVAYPENHAQVRAVLDWADEVGVTVIPFGGGTSVTGGVNSDLGSRRVLSLDLARLDKVVEIDDVSRAARIEAGIFGPALEDVLRPRGLTLRHFPQSFEFSTLGGWIATRSGGHYATVHTHIDDFVESLRAATPRGDLETRRLPASGAGPDPNRWLIGSEGTLGVITEAWMRLQNRPRFKARTSVRFGDYQDAVRATRAMAQSGLNPANCRLLDKREAMLNQVVFDGSHVLILGFESHSHSLEPWMERALELVSDHGGACPDGPQYKDEEGAGDASQNWKDAFLEGPYMQSSLITLGVLADTFETACTWDRFEEFHRGVIASMRDAMLRITGVRGFISCRFTHVYPDGPAPYYTYIAPTKYGSELSQWTELKAAACEAVVSLGGTITHHHSVGRIHRAGYDQERPELFAEMLRASKAVVDPGGILNPGVLID